MNQKDTILLTAFKMFAEKGFDGASLNSIIKETGLTKGGVYYHFSSKEELFKEVVEKYILNYFTEKVRAIVQNSGKSIKERLRELYFIPAVLQKEAGSLFLAESNAFGFHLVFDASRKLEGIKKKSLECYREITALISALIKEGVEENTIKDTINIESLSIELVSLLDGIQIYTAMARDVKIESLLDDFFERTWGSIKI